MIDHLSDAILNALADGELSADQLASASEHLAGCPPCTSMALHLSLLKPAVAKAGRRDPPPPQLQARLARLASEATSRPPAQSFQPAPHTSSRSVWNFSSLGWVTAALLLLFAVSAILVQRSTQRANLASLENAALATEIFDQHIATLAGNMPLQVVSTDRHTVKPWFQGKIPFSFNLPQSLPADTTLDGANLAYLRNQPVAQLLFSIGRHRVSVFLWHPQDAEQAHDSREEHAGFHESRFTTGSLEGVAISDVDPVRLAQLVAALKQAQNGEQQPAN